MSRAKRSSPYCNVVFRTLRVRVRHTECAAYINRWDRRKACADDTARARRNAMKFALIFFSAIALIAAFSAAKAQEPADSKDLRFRRVYAPANRMNDWPTGGSKFLPIDADEFQRLLGMARSGGSQDPNSFSSRITAAEYRAELTVGQVLTGRATLEIVHSGKSPGMLHLDPLSAGHSSNSLGFAGPEKGDSPISADHASMAPKNRDSPQARPK